MDLPEPIGVISTKLGDHCSFMSNETRKGDKVYSEAQVLATFEPVLKQALEAMTIRGAEWVVKEREAINAIRKVLNDHEPR